MKLANQFLRMNVAGRYSLAKEGPIRLHPRSKLTGMKWNIDADQGNGCDTTLQLHRLWHLLRVAHMSPDDLAKHCWAGGWYTCDFRKELLTTWILGHMIKDLCKDVNVLQLEPKILIPAFQKLGRELT